MKRYPINMIKESIISKLEDILEDVWDKAYETGHYESYDIANIVHDAAQQIRLLMIDARIKELKEAARDHYHGHTFSDLTDYKGKFQKFIDNNEYRIKYLESLKENRHEHQKNS